MEDKIGSIITEHRDVTQPFDLWRYWLVLKRRWLPSLVVFLGTLAATTYYISTREPIYEARGKLLIRSGPTRSGTLPEAAPGAPDGFPSPGQSSLATEAEILTSVPVLDETIRALNLRNEAGDVVTPQILKENLEVSSPKDSDTLSITYRGKDPRQVANVVNQLMDAYVKFNASMNRSGATSTQEFVEAELPKAEAEVEQAAEALRQFKARHQIVSLKIETDATVGAMQELNGQISTAQALLADATTRVEQLRQQLGMSMEQALQLDALSQNPGIQQVLAELQMVQARLASERARYTGKHPTIQALERQEAGLQELLSQRVAASLNAESLAIASSGDTNPVASLPSGSLQMTDLRRELAAQLTQAEIDRLSLISQIQALSETRNAYIARSQNFPALEKEQFQLEQQLESARVAYNRLLTHLQSAQLSENRILGNAQILETAMTPIQPRDRLQWLYWLGGIVAGAGFATAIAFLLDRFDKSVKTVKDADRLLGYTLLGLIPRFSTPIIEAVEEDTRLDAELLGKREANPFSPRVIAMQGTHPFIAAAYQMLQANLKFISSDKPLRSIVITSAVEQEGKSEVSANLAATIAQTGKQVLLVDADMRSPSQHHLWGTLNTVGLSHVLVGEGNLKQALVPVADNLTLFPAGIVPPNPLALLDSERMVALATELAQTFDYVIFDTPPLVGAADSAVLGKSADGLLMVVRPQQVDSVSLLAAKDLLTRSRAKVLGFIANGVNIRNEHDDYISLTPTRFYGSGERSAVGKHLPV